MNFVKQIIDNWKKEFEVKKKEREKRKRECEERKTRLEAMFKDFVNDTRPLVPNASKYPEAALFRHVWKRACVYEHIYKEIHNDAEKALVYSEFQKLAADQYWPVAPDNAYGKVPLKLSKEAYEKLVEKELVRLFPKDEPKSKRDINKACIYVGLDSEQNKPYIGQTIGDPEYRWKEHRVNGTGPFKKGASYANWKVIEENVSLNELDELEAYYIGYYNSFRDGHNETKGNNWQSYEKGIRDCNDIEN
ncbi:MAG: GIY-YIG nuclease family protein [Sedimentisphaerales bacterium]|nr:GIY-YIG nuclease family protein [Sedimentisphaerales bacterium]